MEELFDLLSHSSNEVWFGYNQIIQMHDLENAKT